jgi:hypothetical protein
VGWVARSDLDVGKAHMKLKAALIALIALFGVVYMVQTAMVQMWVPPSYHWPAGGYT